MTALSLSDFRVLDSAHPDFLFHRNDERTCSTLYLVKNKTKLLLIDSGDGLDDLDFAPDACFLTHGHYDHTRGVDGDWKDVFIHPLENPKLPHIYIPSNAAQLPSHEFEFGTYKFEILHTPGHTPGSICLFEPQTGFLFSGDTKFAHGGRGRTDLGGSDDKMEQSLDALSQLDYKLLCPGHGEIERSDGSTF